jgi:uncharacterized protein (UPF0218 family)
LIEAIVKLALVDLSPDLTVIDNKVRRVKLKENKIIKSKLTYRKKVSAYERNMK